MLQKLMTAVYQISDSQKSRCLFYGLLVLFFIGFLLPIEQEQVACINDKLLHAMIFMAVMLLAHFTHPRADLLKLAGLLAFYGLCTELAQGLTEDRHLSLADWLADLTGLLAGVVCIRILQSTQ